MVFTWSLLGKEALLFHWREPVCGPLLLTETSRTNATKLKVWINQYIAIKMCDVITHPCPERWLTAVEVWAWMNNYIPQYTIRCNCFSMPLSPINCVSKRGPMSFHNNGPNGHLFYVGGDLMMRRGMLPIIMLPDGDLRIALHLVPFWILTIWGSVHMRKP